MKTMVFTNFPVADLQASTDFYQSLGFTFNKEFSTEQASAMVWDETFWIMLLEHDFYKQFINGKKIADAKTTSSVLTSFSMESAEAVKDFADKAKANGGDYFQVDMGIPEDYMYNLEVLDLDGNHLSPTWMAV